MKLDYDFARELLLYLEENLVFGEAIHAYTAAEALNCDLEKVIYTGAKLNEAGFIVFTIDGPDEGPTDTYICQFYTITFSGHEYLNTIRYKKVWDKVKAAINDNGGGYTLAAIKYMGEKLIEAGLQKYLGI